MATWQRYGYIYLSIADRAACWKVGSTITTDDPHVGFGNILGSLTETPSNAISAYWTTKDLDFTDQDPSMANQWKTVDRVRLEYIDEYTSTPVSVSISIDGGTTWTTTSLSLGTGTGLVAYTDFWFLPITSPYFRFRIGSSDTDTSFTWTGVFAYYYPRSSHFKIQ